MITKIEIDGFKTFRNFKMEFSPFTVIAGTNASGKSNLFDALHLLKRLAETDLKTAFTGQRGEAIELFSQYNDERYAEEISFALEMLTDSSVKDNWGGHAKLKYTRLRYELSIKRVRKDTGIDDLFVTKEELFNLKHQDDQWVRAYIPKEFLEFWRPKVPLGKRGKPYIYTEEKNKVITIKLPQDGKRGGKETPANAVSQTVLSSINSVDFPHVFAAKEEIRNWKFLQLNPESLRLPSSYLSKDEITQTGENLAATLHRIKLNDKFGLKDISRRLNNLLPHLVEVDVFDDKAGKQFVVQVKSEDNKTFSSRVLSEGTLRLLTLCAFLFDDKHKGLICFEEPENGIHPFRIKSIIGLLIELSVDFSDEGSPLRQIIVNTHSPTFLEEIVLISKSTAVSVWFSQLVTSIINIKEKKQKLFATKMIPVTKTGEMSIPFKDQERKLTIAEVNSFLKYAFELN